MKRLSPAGRVLSLCGLLALVFLGLAAFFVQAGQAHAATSYRELDVEEPAFASWRRGITVYLGPDEALCRRHYGNAWVSECLSETIGLEGRSLRGVKMTPEVPGEWRWLYDGTVRFFPKDGHLPPDTRFTLDFSKAEFMADVRLARPVETYQTLPQAVRLDRENVWIDPSDKEAHGISIPLSFIWPVGGQASTKDAVAAMEKAIRLEPSDPGLKLGDIRFAWNPDHDEVVASARILRLADREARIRVSVKNLPSFVQDGGRRYVERGRDAATEFGVPGRGDLFFVKKLEIVKGHDRNLDLRHELVLETSLRVRPKDLLAHMNVVELPEKAEPGALEPTDWTVYPSLGARDLENGKQLSPVLLTGTKETDVVRMSLPVESGRSVVVHIPKDIVSTSGIALKGDFVQILKAPDKEAELSILLPGNVLSIAGSRKIALHALALDSIEWTASRIQPTFLALYAAFQGFSGEPFEPWRESPPIEAQVVSQKGTLPVSPTREGQAAFPVLDLEKMLGAKAHGLYRLELKGMREGREVARCERTLLLTNMGLTIKENVDGGRHIYVNSLVAGSPLANIRVRLLARNGTTLSENVTNAQGMTYLPPAQGLEGELEPVAVTAVNFDTNPDLSWMSLLDSSRIAGLDEATQIGRHGTNAGLLASVFSERGIYMPGDTLHFGVLVRRFDWHALPEKLPLEAVLHDPAGNVVHKAALSGDPNLCEVSWTSSYASRAGLYRLDVRLASEKGQGPVLGSATARVEEFEPDTMAIEASLEKAPKKGWVVTKGGVSPASASVRLRTLYGDDAANHEIASSFVVQPARLTFPDYPGYTFQDASLDAGEARSRKLPSIRTDKGGQGKIDLPADMAPGTFRGTLRVEGFDTAGGRAVARELSAVFSPLEIVAGFRPVDEANNLSWLKERSNASIHVLAVNNELEKTALQNVTLTLSSIRYVNSLVREATGEFRYDAQPLANEIGSRKIAISAQGTKIPLPTEKPGDYLVTLALADGRTLLSVPYTVAGNAVELADGTSTKALKGGDLRLALNRTSFEPGETITVRMNAPYAGTGLITIERENVVESAWFRASAGESEQRIRIPKSFEGQGWVSVLFARTSNSEAIYLKPQVYASVPFDCGMKQRDMGLKITTAESVLPGKTLDIRVRSERRGKALLFAVDEGILSITQYRTPDPLRDLLSGRALDVKTRALFDLLMPDHARLQGRLPAFGGDMENPGGRFLNPFRRRAEPPFARWLGLVDVSREGTTVQVSVPEHLSGAIRIMAVGSSSDGSFLTAGAAEARCLVRGSLIIRPMLPLAASPGDRVEAAVTVANTIGGSGRKVPVELTLRTNEAVVLARDGKETDAASFTLEIDENGEATVPLELLVKDKPGLASLSFEARLARPGSGEEDLEKGHARRSQTFSVRPATLSYASLEHGRLNEGTDIAPSRSLYPMGAKTTLVLGPTRIAAFRGLAQRLFAYPFGCTEQTISRAMPWIASLGAPELADLLMAQPGLDPRKASELEEEAIAKVFAAIRANLSFEGVSLWQGASADDFVTVYAADFVQTLAEYGRGVPTDLQQNLLGCVKRITVREPASHADARIKAYACWVLMRSGTLVTQDAERILSYLTRTGQSWEKDITATLLADCLAMLRLENQALSILPLEIAPIESTAPLFDTGCAWALQAQILSRPFWTRAARDNKAIGEARDRAMTEASRRALAANASTTVQALTARALVFAAARPMDGAPMPRGTCVEYAQGFKEEAREHVLGGLQILEAPGCRRFALENRDGADLGSLRWLVSLEGYDRMAAPQAGKDKAKGSGMSNGMEVKRRYLDGEGKEVRSLRAGDLVTVELKVRSDAPIENVALVDLLPGGLEPLLDQERQRVDTFERREDRMLFFLATDTDFAAVTYKARAMTAGTFQLPAVHAQSMYDPSYAAMQMGGTLEIGRR